MLFNFSSISADPLAFIKSLLITLPGVLLALSIHECAHGWVAERCGDDTARYMGRITLNPMKHIDPMGFLCMLLVGFGWAKPVPVNPIKYKNYRADDLKVSLAGITANLCLFFVCFIAMSAIFIGALSKLGYGSSLGMNDEFAAVVFRSAYAMSEAVIEPAFGKAVSVLYQMIVNCMFINLSLAVFNLIPLPPLDGYHVLNDLALKQDVFAARKTAQYGTMALLVLMVTGVLSKGMGIAMEWVLGGVGDLARAAFSAFGAL
jgi:Zn-dependent protease